MATWADGTPVAVKIQYPGAGDALIADLRTLQALVPVMRAVVPNLDARQLLAELRARLVEEVDYVLEGVRARRLHGDPHPGNFRLLPDGRLVVLDFGATESLPQGWPARLGPLLAAGRDGEEVELHRLAAPAGLLLPGQVTPTDLLALLGADLEPLRVPAYRFTRTWLQEQTRRASDPFSPAALTRRRLSIPPPHLLLQRVARGLVGVLCSLGATVPVHDGVRRWLPGYDAESRREAFT